MASSPRNDHFNSQPTFTPHHLLPVRIICSCGCRFPRDDSYCASDTRRRLQPSSSSSTTAANRALQLFLEHTSRVLLANNRRRSDDDDVQQHNAASVFMRCLVCSAVVNVNRLARHLSSIECSSDISRSVEAYRSAAKDVDLAPTISFECVECFREASSTPMQFDLAALILHRHDVIDCTIFELCIQCHVCARRLPIGKSAAHLRDKHSNRLNSMLSGSGSVRSQVSEFTVSDHPDESIRQAAIVAQFYLTEQAASEQDDEEVIGVEQFDYESSSARDDAEEANSPPLYTSFKGRARRRRIRPYRQKKSNVGHMPCTQNNCSFAFKSQRGFEQHLRVVHSIMGAGEHQCHLCACRFRAGGQLARHRRRVHPNCTPPPRLPLSRTTKRVNECDECGQLFRYPSALQFHLIRHSGIRAHRCSLCAQRFVYKFALASHERHVHSGADDPESEISTTRRVPKKRAPKKKRTPPPPRLKPPNQCKACRKSFATHLLLAMHKKRKWRCDGEYVPKRIIGIRRKEYALKFGEAALLQHDAEASAYWRQRVAREKREAASSDDDDDDVVTDRRPAGKSELSKTQLDDESPTIMQKKKKRREKLPRMVDVKVEVERAEVWRSPTGFFE